MERKYVLTAFGKDRPGIVADVSALIYESGCNLEDSTMTRLMDQFAIILLLSGSNQDLEENLSKGCRRLEIEKGISAFFRTLTKPYFQNKRKTVQHSLHIEGIDHAGIVFKISTYLAGLNINIENLHSEVRISPESGTALYIMEIIVSIPESTSMEELDRGLTNVGEELNVEIIRNRVGN